MIKVEVYSTLKNTRICLEKHSNQNSESYFKYSMKDDLLSHTTMYSNKLCMVSSANLYFYHFRWI